MGWELLHYLLLKITSERELGRLMVHCENGRQMRDDEVAVSVDILQVSFTTM